MLIKIQPTTSWKPLQSFTKMSNYRSISQLSDSSLLRTKGFINGQWVESKKEYPVYDPGQGSILVHVADLDSNDTIKAIQAAQSSYKSWKTTTGRERSNILRKWFDLMMQNELDLARLVSMESGKPLSEARKEIAYGASFIQWFSEEASRTYGDVIPPTVDGRRLLVMKEPVGVCGIITPWNFPNAMITRKAGAALAAGCTIVCKPAPETPLSALALAELGARAGIPKGVLNVLPSSKNNAPQVGLELTTNPAVKKISFTGSTHVGKLLARQCSSTLKKISLELGGNAPFIIFEDADLELAVKGVMNAKFRNTGQTCISANRIYVHSKVFKEFSQRLAERVKSLKLGHGLSENVDVGPLISSQGLDKMHRHVQETVKKGAQVLVGGKHHASGGQFYEPTVLVDCHPESIVAEEETFGPLAALIRFDSEEQVIALANNTPYGLAGYFYSSDTSRIFRVAEALEVGMVGVNEAAISSEVAPFGGVKESGLGREGSKYGIDEYLHIKYVCIGGIQESKL